ncbi:MAG: hypothetical protein GKR90_01385 [Pseudomonadales bacterium]|nr:hypothetical protein [Pseudomonadales bacterium]
MRINLLVVLVGSLFTSWHANADVEREVLICGAKEDTVQRLQCYDKIARLLNSGIRIETLYDYKNNARPAEQSARQVALQSGPKRLTISLVEKLPYSRHQLTMNDGQVWREIEGSKARRYSNGDEVTITEGMLGTFNLVSERNGRRVKVKPVN